MDKYILFLVILCLAIPVQGQQSQTQPSQQQINPVEYLDAPVPSPQAQRAIKIDVINNQLGAQFQNYNIYSMLQMIVNNNLFNDANLNETLNYFLSVWPPAGEMVALERPVVYNNMAQGGSYTVNEMGQLVSQGSLSNYQDDLATNGNQVKKAKYKAVIYTRDWNTSGWSWITEEERQRWVANAGYAGVETIAYPNREAGYPIGAGKFDAVTITTGGKKYVLEEAVIVSPIVLDMDGNGKLEASNGVWLPHTYDKGRVAQFDMDGDGFMDLVEWVGANDGILMVANGQEVNGRNFFGNIDGFTNGYQKLSTLDKNNDKKLSSEELDTLSIWQDKNGNAKVDKGEVVSVVALGITSINLVHNELVSSFVMNGETKKMWDWYPCMFRLKQTR